jgi:3D-(3,5/4)-trihydroxycyclohexane-1,2-dione acylhydrolase (decyclizing)
VSSVTDLAGLEKALADAQAADVTTVIHIETDPLVPAPDSPAWWDVPVAEASVLESTRAARTAYEASKARQRTHLSPPDSGRPEGSTDPAGHP